MNSMASSVLQGDGVKHLGQGEAWQELGQLGMCLGKRLWDSDLSLAYILRYDPFFHIQKTHSIEL